MSTLAIGHLHTFPERTHSPLSNLLPLDCINNSLCDVRTAISTPENWLYLVPTIGVVAIGILFAPNFAVGLAIGAGLFAITGLASVALTALGIMKSDNDSEYANILREFPLLGTLVAPIGEELIFRGAMQPLVMRAIVWLVPAATAALFGTGFSIAVTVSVVATAVIFGAMHALNNHKNAHIQAIIATVNGIALGLIAAQFGLGASIAAHMAINTLVVTILKLSQ